MHRDRLIIRAVLCLLLGLAAGCPPPTPRPTPPALLPRQIRLHPFTRTWQGGEGGAAGGIEARVEAIDHFGDTTKAFGTFRFEAFAYRPHEADPAGRRLAVWSVQLADAEDNLTHWDRLSRTYKFRLMWPRAVAAGESFALRVTFAPPEGLRLFDEQVLVSGE
ncbi:MAG: hypothetical protein GX591_01925 [Planctomycetes bacterium]|nr:hypothetical protein [Planctomycetota bacterium]